MTKDEYNNTWLYFCSLTDQLNKTTQFVDHSTDNNGIQFNAKTFSHEFVKIIMLASSEFEVICRELCSVSGKRDVNIVSLSKTIIAKFPKITDTIIHSNYSELVPLKDWKVVLQNGTEQVEGLDWWHVHNSIKHNRSISFQGATLSNCVNSMASLMVLELYLGKTLSAEVSNDYLKYFINDYSPKFLITESGDPLPDFVRKK